MLLSAVVVTYIRLSPWQLGAGVVDEARNHILVKPHVRKDPHERTGRLLANCMDGPRSRQEE